MVEVLGPRPPFARLPELDVGELRRRASEVEVALQRACAVPVPQSDADDRALAARSERDPEEKRIDPADGKARTLDELRMVCAGRYSPQEIDDYWKTNCMPVEDGGGYASAPAAMDEKAVAEALARLREMFAAEAQKVEPADSGAIAPGKVPGGAAVGGGAAGAAAAAAAAAAGAKAAEREEESNDPAIAIRGEWVSDKGECLIFEDHRTNRLSYEEMLPDGCRLHGFLSKLDGFREEGIQMAWQAELAILGPEEDPWYGPSFGEPPEPVGDIQVRFRSSASVETRIRVEGEDDDWQPPSLWRRQERAPAPDVAEDVFVFGGSPRH